MTIVIGTRDGVFRSESTVDAATEDATLEDAERVLDAGNTLRVRAFDERGTFAATVNGLFRSTDDGHNWRNLDVPREEVFSVVTSPDGERLFAGTHPAHLYVSTDEGESWAELEGFQELPSREEWYTPRHRNEAHIRSLGVHPDTPERVVAGVEVGGVHVSDVHESEALVSQPEPKRSGDDSGTTWTERRDGLQDDVHHVLVRSSEEHVASCGGGLYRTQDVGRSWTRLDTEVPHRYFREAFAYDGRLYAAAARGPPGSWRGESGADAAVFESVDDGDTLESVSYTGGPEEFVLAWTTLDGRVLAGTNGGRVLVRRDGTWETLGEVPATIRSLSATAASS